MKYSLSPRDFPRAQAKFLLSLYHISYRTRYSNIALTRGETSEADAFARP